MGVLWDLLVAVAQGWLSLMSGVAGLAMTLYGFWTRREVTGRVFLTFGTLSLVVALAMTWIAEHQTVEDTRQKLAQANQKLADLRKPLFVVSLPDIAYTYSEQRQATVVRLSYAELSGSDAGSVG